MSGRAESGPAAVAALPDQAFDALGGAARGRWHQEVVVWWVRVLSWLLERLPDATAHRIAGRAGVLLYLVWPRRRALVRANLRQVCTWLVRAGRATPEVAAAAADRRSLERLVRSAFRHYLRYYVEVAMTPSYTPAFLADHLRIDTPDVVDEALPPPGVPARGRIFVGLHLGAIELPGLYAVHHARVPITSPMEAIPNVPLQQYLVRRRGTIGVRIVPLRGARTKLLDALARGEIAGLVADRDVSGHGHPVTLFGAPTRLPTGPALLAIESGATTFVAAARRTGPGDYALRAIRLEWRSEGRLRDRVAAFLDAEARAFEDLVADAPDQWWTVFFPIWPAGFARTSDLVGLPR